MDTKKNKNGKGKQHQLSEMLGEGGEYIKWYYLPQINGYRITSISCDEERKNWKYECYSDPLGNKAAELHLLKATPPQPIFELFGITSLDGEARTVFQIRFKYWSSDPTRPNPIVVVRSRKEKQCYYFEPVGTCFTNIAESQYGAKLIRLIGNKFILTKKTIK